MNVKVLETPITERYCKIGDEAILDEENKQIRCGGAWYPFDERWKVEKAIDESDKINWWNFKTEDDKTWLMMKHGFDTSFDPSRIKNVEKVKLYDLENQLE